MNIDTTKQQFRKLNFKKIHKIIAENFGVSIQNENAKVSTFCSHLFQVVEFEILLQDEFGGKIELDQNPTISEILDMICQS